MIALHQLIPGKLLFFASALILTGCATPTSQPNAPTPTDDPAKLSNSSVEISYLLGHTHRRLYTQAKASDFVAQTFHNHHILKENLVDQPRYSRFLSKALQFIALPRRLPADCRDPFTVTVRLQGDTKSVQGCRNTDEGSFSHLVREGEFLLYSKK